MSKSCLVVLLYTINSDKLETIYHENGHVLFSKQQDTQNVCMPHVQCNRNKSFHNNYRDLSTGNGNEYTQCCFTYKSLFMSLSVIFWLNLYECKNCTNGTMFLVY